MRIVFFVVFSLFSIESYSSVIEGCAEYRAIGLFKQKGKSVVLNLNEGTNSEVEIEIKNASKFFNKKIKKTYAVATVRIKEKCNFQCSGELVEVKRVISLLDYEQNKNKDLLKKIKECK